ncbi:MAG: UvrB/UvrC motif-containing protein, partial [Acidimicrobiales bacterium]
NGINPQTIRKAVNDILEQLRPGGAVPAGGRGRGRGGRARSGVGQGGDQVMIEQLGPTELGAIIQQLRDEMHEASAELRFEDAAALRDEIAELDAHRHASAQGVGGT